MSFGSRNSIHNNSNSDNNNNNNNNRIISLSERTSISTEPLLSINREEQQRHHHNSNNNSKNNKMNEETSFEPARGERQDQEQAQEQGQYQEQGDEDDGLNMTGLTTSPSSNSHHHHQYDIWIPTGNSWQDFLHFVGPGWFVSIAYVDPGNFQADIQAGATSRYSLLFVIWWTTLLSIYVQILCVRLAYYGKAANNSGKTMNLAQIQAATQSNAMRYCNWAIAEFSTVLTDLPEVIGIGIACKIFFGFPYYVGVLLSLITTMLFLATMKQGIRVLEVVVFGFIAVMCIALWIEMSLVGVHTGELLQGWIYGISDISTQDIFTITGILGAVVMPHNLYLHTASCQHRPVSPQNVQQAVRFSTWEPVLPILISFFVNMAVVAIAAERVYGTTSSSGEEVGLTDFCEYFVYLKAGCALWGVALLAAGQSSAITTTYTGQYIMDGFLNIQLPVEQRAVITRLVAITPCVIVSVLFPDDLNKLVSLVNASLSLLLPFAFTPLVKYVCSESIMGTQHAARGREKILLHVFAIGVWAINAATLSLSGGGFFGDIRDDITSQGLKVIVTFIEVAVQILYVWWNFHMLFRSPVDIELVGGSTNIALNNNDGDINNDSNEEHDGVGTNTAVEEEVSAANGVFADNNRDSKNGHAEVMSEMGFQFT